MSWNPNQGQEPNQPGQYGNYNPQQQGNPYQGGYQGYQQQPGYGQQQGGYQQGQYGQPGAYQQPGYQQYGTQGNYQQPYGTPGATANANGPTSMGMDANTAAGLSYLLSIIISFISGIIFFVLEKQNRFVRFHAMQSILLNVAAIALFIIFFILQVILFATVILAPIGGLFTCLSFLAPLAAFVLSIVLGIMAFQGKYFKLPIIGDYAEKFANPTV